MVYYVTHLQMHPHTRTHTHLGIYYYYYVPLRGGEPLHINCAYLPTFPDGIYRGVA